MPNDITAEFANADLKDLRRTRRLDKVVAAWTKAPALSIAAASGGWKESLAAYRLLNCGEVKPAALIACRTMRRRRPGVKDLPAWWWPRTPRSSTTPT